VISNFKLSPAVLADDLDSDGACLAEWSQCGGARFEGEGGCCEPDNVCMLKNAYYSQCRPLSRPFETSEGFLPIVIDPSSANYTAMPPIDATPMPVPVAVEDAPAAAASAFSRKLRSEALATDGDATAKATAQPAGEQRRRALRNDNDGRERTARHVRLLASLY
jgi:Fungal cellulose binding domain